MTDKQTRAVTENDFRKDEFKNKDPDDYEFRNDGKIVRKDRWEMGIRNISSILSLREIEVADVVERVRELNQHNIDFLEYQEIDFTSGEVEAGDISLMMEDGSILRRVNFILEDMQSDGKKKVPLFTWNTLRIPNHRIARYKC